jgi:hypothetical protein
MPELTWPLTVFKKPILLCTGVRRLGTRVGASDIARRSRASAAACALRYEPRGCAAAVLILV